MDKITSALDIKSKSALWEAATTGDLPTVINIVEARPLLVTSKSLHGNTSLHNAAANGHLEVVEWLVETGNADVDATDSKGKTSLHRCSNNGHSEVVKFLLGKTNNPKIRDAAGKTAKDLASEKGFTEVVELLASAEPAEKSRDLAIVTNMDPYEKRTDLLQAEAFDAFVVQSSTTGRVASSDFFISFDHSTAPFPPSTTDSCCEALLEIRGNNNFGKIYFPIDHDHDGKQNLLQKPPRCDSIERTASFRKLCEDQEVLQLLATILKPGKNQVRYLFRNDSRVLGVADASIFLCADTDQIIVSDLDGTITKSNVRGIYEALVTEDYVHCHEKVCRFLSSVKNRDDVHVLYMTSRPLSIAQATRKFLSDLRQPAGEDDDNCDDCRLPKGALIGYGGPVADVMKMELVTKTVHLFKAGLLMDQLVTPFCQVTDGCPHERHQSMFVAAFGNTWMDVKAYHMAGLKLDQIYMIDKQSTIVCMDADAARQQEEQQQEGQQQQEEDIEGSKKESNTQLFTKKVQSSLSNLLGGSSHHKPSHDDAVPAEQNDDQRPAVKEPMSQAFYKKQAGTSFQGYHDEALAAHVLDSLKH